MPSLREYLILSHIEARVDLYQRGDAADPQWRYSCLRGEDSFALTCLHLTLTVPELFAGVTFEPVVDLDAL
jgi:Uma2 family endonuclease